MPKRTTVVPVLVLIALALAPAARAEWQRPTFAVHGYGELQLRTYSKNWNRDYWVPSQWAHVLNLEFESDLAPEGLGPFEVLSAFARVVRGAVLSVKSEAYMEAAKVLGSSNWRMARQHVVPNIMAPMIVLTTVYLSSAILSEAALSFLGLGTQPPEPTWGGMLNIARTYMEISPWMAIFPGLAIAILVLGFNFLGDGLRDVLDPRLRER